MKEYNELVFTNKDCKFIKGIRVKNYPELFDLTISGSNARESLDWEFLDFQRNINFEVLEFTFNQPQNFFKIKLEISGNINLDFLKESIEFIEFNKYSKSEIKEILSRKKIAFLGCARDCEKTIRSSLEKLSNIGSYFNESSIFIFENNSADNTLNAIKSTDLGRTKLNLFSLDDLDSHLPKRTQRLSFLRNFLINQINFDEVDYFCIADLDGILDSTSLTECFLSNFEYDSCWDAVFPVNEKKYYDVWAFRHKQFWNFDYERKMNGLPGQILPSQAIDFYVERLSDLQFAKMASWLNVDSAFGGIGLYKAASFKGCQYRGYDGVNQICEHVHFHSQARKKGAKLYINPAFIVKDHQ